MTKLTPKQEAFVQAYHRLGNQRHAYKAAYNAENMNDNTIDNRASELMQHGGIKARLQELQEALAKTHEVTIETITKMLAKAYEIATEEKQASAAVAASMGLGKLHGLIVEKRHVETTDKNKAAREMSDDDLINLAKAGSTRVIEEERSAKIVN